MSDFHTQDVSHETTAKAATQAWLTTAILDQFDHGILLLGPGHRVLFANRVAQRECARHPALHIQDATICAHHARDKERLVKALADASRGLRTLLSFDAGSGGLPCAVLPLHAYSGAANGMPHPGATVVVFAKRRGTETLNVDLFARTCCLTTTECDVLKGLTTGLTPNQLALRSGTSLATIRTHILHIRQKTLMPNIQSLVSLVHNLPPVVCSTDTVGC